MVRAENKYEVHLLDEENAWGKPTEEQEKIVAMSAEIKSLEKECGSSLGKINKLKQAAKKQAPKKAASKKPADKKKKATDKWAWKNKPPKESDPKENEAFVETFEHKKYYWCKNHNNRAGMWTLHHPNDCESGAGSNRTAPNTNVAAFDTVDSDSECLLRQGQGFPWFWLTVCYHPFWLLIPNDVGMTITAFLLTFNILFILMLKCVGPEEKHPYVPKRLQPPKILWTKSMLKAMACCKAPLIKTLTNMKVCRRYRPLGHRSAGHRSNRHKKCSRDYYLPIPIMTTTWANDTFKTPPGSKQFDSDSRALMLDDSASACITNDNGDFIKPPKRVDRKVSGIKGHTKATHRGTLKWHVEDDNGLVHVMVIKGAYLIPEAATQILSPQHLAQQADDHYPKNKGTGALTTSKHIMLFWSQQQFTKTVPLDPNTNVGLTTTASGARSFRAFCATIDKPETRQTNIFTTHIIPDDDDDESFQPKDPVEPPQPPQPTETSTDKVLKTNNDAAATTPQATVIDIGPITHVIPEDQEPKSLDPQDELLQWHYCLGHLPFDCIKQLATKGQLPK